MWNVLCVNIYPLFVLQDLVKSHLMYAVREEVEVLKEHIKELYEKNSVLERENALLKSLANSEQLGQLSKQLTKGSSCTSPLLQQQQQQYPLVTNNINNGNSPLVQSEGGQIIRHQPNITSAWAALPHPQWTRFNTWKAGRSSRQEGQQALPSPSLCKSKRLSSAFKFLIWEKKKKIVTTSKLTTKSLVQCAHDAGSMPLQS